jgi:hypothetical protein
MKRIYFLAPQLDVAKREQIEAIALCVLTRHGFRSIGEGLPAGTNLSKQRTCP